MIGLNQDERKSIAEKLMEFGNLSGAGFIIGQFIPIEQAKSGTLMLAGIGLWLGFWLVGVSIMRGGGRSW